MAISNQASVKNALDLAKNEILEINRKEFQLHELERKVETNQKLVDTISERVAEIGATQGLQPTKVSIMDRAIVPAAPFKPNRNMIMLFGLVGGLLLGIFWCLVREFFDKTIKKVDDVEDRLNLPMLGFLPRIKTGKIFRNKAKRPELYFISKPQSKFAEAMRNIRTNVVLSSVDDSRKIIMVTSSRSGEGKSVLSLNLASAFAENSKVLLIDADMRDPSLGEYFGLDKSANGLSHYTAGLCSLSECIYKFDDSKISFIPAGIIPPNPLTLLSSQRFANLLNVLKEEYSNIIIDSPPVLAVGDSAMLSRLVSGVIMVVRSESTPHKLAQEAIRRLRACRGAPLLGVVLNDLHIKRYSSYDASYGYGLTTE
jgi:capsular exopolysaccharide synthesis family protein